MKATTVISEFKVTSGYNTDGAVKSQNIMVITRVVNV